MPALPALLLSITLLALLLTPASCSPSPAHTLVAVRMGGSHLATPSQTRPHLPSVCHAFLLHSDPCFATMLQSSHTALCYSVVIQLC